jgi:hypothetical protein
MRKFLRYQFIVLISTLLVVPALSAQNSLQSTEQALLNRALDALNELYIAGRYIEHGTQTASQLNSITQPDNTAASTMDYAIDMEYTIQIIRENSTNLLANYELELDLELQPSDRQFGFTLEAELRYVDDQLYGNAEYIEADQIFPALPQDWQHITNPANSLYPVLPLTSIMQLAQGRDLEALLIEDRAFATEMIQTVSVEEGVWIDGTPAELITITFDGKALTETQFDLVFGDWESSDPETLRDAIRNGIYVRIVTYALDEEGHLIGRRVSEVITLPSSDYVLISGDSSSQPVGTTIAVTQQFTSEATFSRINDETLQPASIPDQTD